MVLGDDAWARVFNGGTAGAGVRLVVSPQARTCWARRVKGKLLRVAGRGNARMESSRSGHGPRCRAEAVRC
jgi:hypothetical protein